MALILNGYSNFRYLTLYEVSVNYFKETSSPFYTQYTFEDSVIAEGSSASIEEIKVNDINVGIKSNIKLILAYSDFTAIDFLDQYSKQPITNVKYYLKNCSGLSVPDMTITVNHSDYIKTVVNSKIVEGEYAMAEIDITVVDDATHITDVMTVA